jgi:hypothetical protein
MADRDVPGEPRVGIVTADQLEIEREEAARRAEEVQAMGSVPSGAPVMVPPDPRPDRDRLLRDTVLGLMTALHSLESILTEVKTNTGEMTSRCLSRIRTAQREAMEKLMEAI